MNTTETKPVKVTGKTHARMLAEQNTNETKHTPGNHKLIVEFASESDMEFFKLHNRTMPDYDGTISLVNCIRRSVIKPDDSGELVEALKFAVATLTQPVQFSGTISEGACALLRGDAAEVVAQARAALANHAGKGDK